MDNEKLKQEINHLVDLARDEQDATLFATAGALQEILNYCDHADSGHVFDHGDVPTIHIRKIVTRKLNLED